MDEDEERNHVNSVSNEKEQKTVELPAVDFFKINFISFLVPLYVCLGLFLLFEYLFINLFSIPKLIHLFLLPGFLLVLYYVYLIILIEFTAFWAERWNRKSPPKEGVFRRVLDDINSEEGRMMKYYHKRGFIIKLPMWLTSKSPFPWLVNRTLRRISHNKIGQNVIYCDGYVGLEFTDLGDNVFIYPTSGLSSHAVNTIFGKITMAEIKLGKNTTLYPGIIVGPNAVTLDNNIIFPNTVLHKNWRGKPDKLYYQGSPGRPIEVKHLNKIDNKD
jgi:acetyltransferase-like isoleucine patch superfamily enzyme